MSADNPYADLNEAREQGRHHAAQARQWADAADREELREETSYSPGSKMRGQRYAAISQAHAFAALATAIGGDGIVSIEDLSR